MELSPHDAAVMRCVLYFDVFKHPLNRAEIAAYTAATPENLLTLGLLVGDALLHRPGREPYVTRRRERAEHAERLWPSAMRAGRALAQLPFVRGVMLTGGLSKQSAEPGGDADFLLLVEPGCVWTTKSMLQLARRAMPPSIRRLFCTNYLLASDALLLDDHDVFTAFELAAAVPLAGQVCGDFLRANPWTRQWVPGLDWAIARADQVPHVPARLPLLTTARRLDPALQARWSRLWDQKYAWVPDRERRFKRAPDRATNHLHDFRQFVISGYEARCAEVGITP